MSNLGPQQINTSYPGLLQVPGGLTTVLQYVSDGAGNTSPWQLSTTSIGFGALQLSGSINMGGNAINNLATPVLGSDAATKAYVDSVAVGLQPKTEVKAATIGNITLSGTQIIDGVTLSSGDRVLVKNQAIQSTNGIYTVSSGPWSRASDADTWAELVRAYVFVQSGSQAASSFVCDIPPTGTLGVDPINWILFSQSSTVLSNYLTFDALGDGEEGVTDIATEANSDILTESSEFLTIQTPSALLFNGSSPLTISYNSIGAADINGYDVTPGSVWNINVLGNAETVTNGVYTSTNYLDPSWLTGLASSKLIGAVSVNNGGTGASTLSGVLYGNGTSAVTSATGSQISTAIGSTPVAYATNLTGTLSIANGGTGQTTASAAINALLPAQSGNYGHVLSTNGINVAWDSALTLSVGNIGVSCNPAPWASTGNIQANNLSFTSVGTLGANAYYNGGYKYIDYGPATALALAADAGFHWYSTATPGYSGTAIPFNEVMTLSAGAKLTVAGDIQTGGNVGIGSNISAWGSGSTIEMSSSAIHCPDTATSDYAQNVYLNSTPQWIRKNNGPASIYRQTSGTHEFYVTGSGSAGSVATFGAPNVSINNAGNLNLANALLLNGSAGTTGQVPTSTGGGAMVWGTGGGATGPIGPTGPSGPIGPTGPAGSAGNFLYFNIIDYGASSGGSASTNTTAINNAVAAAVAAGGGTVFIPRGTYYINGTITVYTRVRFQGSGQDVSYITRDTSFNGDMFVTDGFASYNAQPVSNSYGEWGPYTQNSGPYEFGFFDLTINGNAYNTPSANGWTLLIFGSGYTIQNVKLENNAAGGFYSRYWTLGTAGADNTTYEDSQMEARIINFYVSRTRSTGNSQPTISKVCPTYAGPHDSQLENIIVSQTSYGITNSSLPCLYIGVGAQGSQINNIHPWSSYTQYCLWLDASLLSIYNVELDNCASGGALLLVNANSNIIEGKAGADTGFGYNFVQMGTASYVPGGNSIKLDCVAGVTDASGASKSFTVAYVYTESGIGNHYDFNVYAQGYSTTTPTPVTYTASVTAQSGYLSSNSYFAFNSHYDSNASGTGSFTQIAGAIQLSGSQGTSGQVLTSAGAGGQVYWSNAGGGSGGWTQSGSNTYTYGNVGIGVGPDSVAKLNIYNSSLGANTSTLAFFNRTTDGDVITFFEGGTYAGKVYYSGGVVGFAPASDYRLKENVSAISDAIDSVMSLNPVKYNMTGHEMTAEGFLAHEAQQVLPFAVSGVKDEVDEDGNPIYQGLDYSRFVPLLTAAIKELVARVKALENKG